MTAGAVRNGLVRIVPFLALNTMVPAGIEAHPVWKNGILKFERHHQWQHDLALLVPSSSGTPVQTRLIVDDFLFHLSPRTCLPPVSDTRTENVATVWPRARAEAHVLYPI